MPLPLTLLAITALLPASTWGLDRIDVTDAAPASSGATVDVYVIDSGVARHAELAGRIESGHDALDPSGNGTNDCNGHGTHVAGTIAGATTGVAPNATIIPVRILDCAGSGSSTAVVDAADWIVDHHQSGQPAVANLSLIGPASDVLDDAAQRMIDDGITVVVAAGNFGTDACTLSPARLPDVITVAASDRNDRRPSWSGYGPCVDLHAPGENITSLAPNGGTSVRSGTSTASPHVAGAAAVLLAAQPSLSPGEVAAQLVANAISVVPDNGTHTTSLLVQVAGTPITDAATTPLVRTATQRVTSRLVDTRNGTGGIAPGHLHTDDTLIIPIANSSDNDVAVLTLTVTDTSAGPAGGYLTVEPCGTTGATGRNVSTLNFTSGQTIANTALVPVGHDHRVCVSIVGTAHVIVDRQAVLDAADGLHAIDPFRRVDTRTGLGNVAAQPISTGGELRIPITGIQGIPATGVSAISANLTVTDTIAPAYGGYASVRPCDQPHTDVSNINFATGQTVANAMFAALSRSGDLCITVHGTAHIIIDINGWITSDGRIRHATPQRLIDTRRTIGTIGSPSGAPTTVALDLGASPALPDDATAAIINLTITDVTAPDTGAYASVHACWSEPENSNLNATSGQHAAVTLIAPLSTGRTCLTAVGAMAIIVDLQGWFAP